MNFLIAILRRAFREEDGQAIVLAAISFVGLLGFAGMAVDVGQLHIIERQMQSAADAAAIAGALEISDCGSTTDCSAMTTAAQKAVSDNGLSGSTLVKQCATPGSESLILTVDNGPCALGSAGDPNYKNSQYVETVIRKVQPTIFAAVLGIPSVGISVRAEATVSNYPNCFVISGYSPNSNSNQLILNGSDTLDMPTCGIMDNSDSGGALIINGTNNVTTGGIYVHGGDILNNSGTLSPTPVTGVNPQTDPLNWLNSNKPQSSGCTYNNETVNGGSTTLSAGTYCGGLTLNSSVDVTFNPGVYIIEGNLMVDSESYMSGSGVTFYFTDSGTLMMNGLSHTDLVAPTTGTYAGILFYQDPADTSEMILNGDSTSIFQGAVYSPTGSLIINGEGNLAAYTIVDVASAIINGNFSLGSDYSSLPKGSPAKGITAVLAE